MDGQRPRKMSIENVGYYDTLCIMLGNKKKDQSI